MTVTVRLPAPLRGLAGGARDVQVEGETVAQVLERLASEHGALRAQLLDEEGELRPFVNCFVNDEEVRALGGTDAAVKTGDVITIVPAIAGGNHG
jgi:sulfur-carrier protein